MARVTAVSPISRRIDAMGSWVYGRGQRASNYPGNFQGALELFPEAPEVGQQLRRGPHPTRLPDEPLFPALLDQHRQIPFDEKPRLGGQLKPPRFDRLQQSGEAVLLNRCLVPKKTETYFG